MFFFVSFCVDMRSTRFDSCITAMLNILTLRYFALLQRRSIILFLHSRWAFACGFSSFCDKNGEMRKYMNKKPFPFE